MLYHHLFGSWSLIIYFLIEKLVDSNSYSIGLGIEYDVTEKVAVSCGYLRSQVGVSEEYQTDFSYELNSDTFGFGGRIKLTPTMIIELGGLYGKYSEADKTMAIPEFPLSFPETYQLWNWAFSVGLEFYLK